MAGASNSDVQYVAYLKAKFNLADADLLQVIALSQRPTPTRSLSSAPEGEDDIEVVEDDAGEEEEEKAEVDGAMDASAYEEVVEDEESYEEVEYMEESFTENASPSPAPAPIPLVQQEEPRQAESQALVESPEPSPEELVEAPAPATHAIVPVEDAPHDEIEQELESEVPPLKYPEPVEPSTFKESVVRVEAEAPDDEAQAFAETPAIEPAPQEDPNALAIVPAKSQGLVPVPEQAPPVDEVAGADKKKPPASPPLRQQEPEEKDNSFMIILVAFCLLLLIAIAIILILIFVTETIPKFWESDPDPVTMGPYRPGNCNFDGQAQPNVVSQCECTGQVNEVNAWTQEQYDRLTTEFIPTIYSSWTLPIESCEPANQALLWLSTGEVIEDQLTLTQRYTMAFLYYATAGQKWTTQTDWMSEEDVCAWHGLTCVGDEIQQIELPNNALDGLVPAELAFLDRLETLSLDENNLRDSIPSQLFTMTNLKTLTLGTNRFVGSIPTQVGQATGLENLRLNGNLFQGLVPTQLNQLTRLVSLSLEENPMLTGRIATEYGAFTNLQSLALSSTDIRARIPTEYGRLTNLQELKIANTLVGGDIPSQFGSLTRLRIVDLSGSRFRSSIPTFMGQLTELSILLLGNNELEGEIPSELGRLTRLRNLTLHDNELSGLVPTELSSLSNLANFTLQGNPFLSGNMPEEICMLSEDNLKYFVADCPTREFGVLCPITSCCSECVELAVEEP